jgi:hypothetical protein
MVAPENSYYRHVFEQDAIRGDRGNSAAGEADH